MDIAADSSLELSTLSYDDTIPYEDQFATHPSIDMGRASLANRIGTTKVYLLSESAVARVGKRKHDSEEGEDAVIDEDGDTEMDEEGPYRPNAILFQGPPICHLPTGRLFAYATHFDAHPLAIEWISDNTFNFIFESTAAARNAQRHLQKSPTEDADEDGFVTAKSIPVTLWPPEHRVNATLGKGEGLKGVIRMRWAKKEDVKKKGAKKQSDFYKKYGHAAGKEIGSERNEIPQKKRRRDDGEIDEALRKAQLDDDLDAFLAEGDEEPVTQPSPPSKMYSDYISNDGRTLLERTSLIRVHPTDLASRITAPLPRRAREREFETRLSPRDNPRRIRDIPTDNKGGRGKRGERPKKSQQDLDDELEDFLKGRN